MKSINHLTITGVITGIKTSPERNSMRFTLIHYFGGNNTPLILPCISKQIDCHKGQSLRIRACPRSANGRFHAVVNKVEFV